MDRLSRRSLLVGSACLAGLAASEALSGCAPTTSISSDPSVLTLWYWPRAVSAKLLKSAGTKIPDTSRRVRADVIGGNFDLKLRTSLAGHAYIPDITGLNSNVASYFPVEDQFIDFHDLGAEHLRSEYSDWKWQLGITPTNRMCFWPMDTGPTALWYRRDIFAKASLPDDPDAVSEALTDWPQWLEAGAKLKRNTGTYLMANAQVAFNGILSASSTRYFAQDGTPLYEEHDSTVRRAWDLAVTAAKAGITAKAQTDAEKNPSYSTGKTVANIEAVWWSAALKAIAPSTSGKWGVAGHPGGPGNNGGSFLAIPKSSKDPQAAFKLITWLTSPKNQAQSYRELQLFPSTPTSFDTKDLSERDEFFGDQPILRHFTEASTLVPTTYISPYEGVVSDGLGRELVNVETQNKNPERAWDDAMAQGLRQLKKRGLAS